MCSLYYTKNNNMKKIFSLAIIGLLALAPTLVNAQDSSRTKKSKLERKKEMKEK